MRTLFVVMCTLNALMIGASFLLDRPAVASGCDAVR